MFHFQFLQKLPALKRGHLRKRVFHDLKGEKPKCGMEKWQNSFVILTEDLVLAYKDANQEHDNPNLIFDSTQCKGCVRLKFFDKRFYLHYLQKHKPHPAP